MKMEMEMKMELEMEMEMEMEMQGAVGKMSSWCTTEHLFSSVAANP